MGAMECAGCTMIAFGPALAIFIIVIARDPLRVILFVAGAFFWLLALLVSALLWFAVVPLREVAEFGLFFSVAFQEVFRFLYFLLLKKAESGLEKVSQNGMHIEGVHSLKNAKHTIALVCGLGFGFMSGAFAYVNVLADANGPGTVGFPSSAVPIDADEFGKHMSYNFFFTSALSTLAFILLHVLWNVTFWHGCRTNKYGYVIAVIASHFLCSGMSLFNRKGMYYFSLPITFGILFLTMGGAFFIAGGSFANIRRLVREARTGSHQSARGEQIVQQQQAIG